MAFAAFPLPKQRIGTPDMRPAGSTKGVFMLGWALTFLIIALIAGVLGFGGIAGTAAGIAKILFFIFLALLVVSLLGHLLRPRSGSRP